MREEGPPARRESPSQLPAAARCRSFLHMRVRERTHTLQHPVHPPEERLPSCGVLDGIHPAENGGLATLVGELPVEDLGGGSADTGGVRVRGVGCVRVVGGDRLLRAVNGGHRHLKSGRSAVRERAEEMESGGAGMRR